MRTRSGICLALLLSGLVGAARGAQASAPATLQRYQYVQPEMGTVFHLLICAPDQKTADAAADAAWTRVAQLTKVFSDYDPDSELDRLCRQTDHGPMAQPIGVSDDLWAILNDSIDAARLSGGAFDITVGPLTRLQRLSRKTGKLPDPDRLKQALQCVGWKYIQLSAKGHRVQLLHAHMQLDVGGIAKGYTSDQILKLLRQRGLSHSLCGAAGDIDAGDPPPGKPQWRIGIQSLQSPGRSSDYVDLHDYGISTSGDTYRSAVVNGKRYSHLIDPRTGLGLTLRIGVSAVAPHDVTADWITAAISILGVEKGMKMVDSIEGAAARAVILDEKGRPHVYESRRMADFLVPRSRTTAPANGPVNSAAR